MTLDESADGGAGSAGSRDSRVDIHVSTMRSELCPSEVTIENLATGILQGENVAFERVGLVLGDHELVTDLNRRYLDHDWDTDVLSFLLSDDAPIEGEVYVDVQTAAERCSEFGTSPAQEILRYVAHGVLHLAGYDDGTDDGRAEMRALEDSYLSKLPGGA